MERVDRVERVDQVDRIKNYSSVVLHLRDVYILVILETLDVVRKERGEDGFVFILIHRKIRG